MVAILLAAFSRELSVDWFQHLNEWTIWENLILVQIGLIWRNKNLSKKSCSTYSKLYHHGSWLLHLAICILQAFLAWLLVKSLRKHVFLLSNLIWIDLVCRRYHFPADSTFSPAGTHSVRCEVECITFVCYIPPQSSFYLCWSAQSWRVAPVSIPFISNKWHRRRSCLYLWRLFVWTASCPFATNTDDYFRSTITNARSFDNLVVWY